ncbi:MAG: hypothetical protein ACHQFW_06325 [Chitinophagales bacterium]
MPIKFSDQDMQSQNKVVEVFKTNVQNEDDAKRLLHGLAQRFPDLKITFDLDDIDRIMRVEGTAFLNESISDQVYKSGFECSVLE